MTPFRLCPLLKARASPLEKGGQSPPRATRPPSHHYCALIEPLCVRRGHYDHFLLLIAHPFRPLNSLHGQLWAPLSAAAWAIGSAHRQRLAPTDQGDWVMTRWLNGGRAPPSMKGA